MRFWMQGAILSTCKLWKADGSAKQSRLSADTQKDFRWVLQAEDKLPPPPLGKLGSICSYDSTFFLCFSLQLAITPACFPHLINELNKIFIGCLFYISMSHDFHLFVSFFKKIIPQQCFCLAHLLFKNSLIFKFYLCVHTEARGQPAGVNQFSVHLGHAGDWTWVVRLGGTCLCPWSHPASTVGFFPETESHVA